MDMDAIKDVFFQECEDQLMELETGLASMQDGDHDRETIGAVFRAVHSIKGGGGAFGLDELVRFAHVFETVLDEIRSDRLSVTSEILPVLFRASDILSDLVKASRDGLAAEGPEIDEVAAQLQKVAAGEVPSKAGTGEKPAPALADEPTAAAPMALDDEIEFEPVPISLDDFDFGDAEEGPSARLVVLRFRPKTDFYARGHEPGLLVRELQRLGATTTVCLTEGLPQLDDIDPEQPYLAWQVTVETDASEQEIREIFEFVEWDCELEIEAGDDVGDAEVALEEPAADTAALSDMAAELRAAETAPQVPAEPVAAAAPAASEPQQAVPEKAEPEARRTASAAAQTIRVDLDRVDRLINLVGEMVISQAMLAQSVSELEGAQAAHLDQNLDDLQQLAREIQDSVMAIRAQPVKPVFHRMARVVREVSDATGKAAVLVTEGEGTEVDKTIIDGLAEPLTHMIRNSIDHGLESREERVRLGKPEEGQVRLSARHRSGRIIIQVADDGAGINREKVYDIAVKKGLVSEKANLSDDEIDNLIFLPGFSTATTVSDISGRGVGMDVVRSSIQNLGGRISISSTPGKGSVFTLSLPLTLAVLDGMIVSAAGQTLVLPLSAIIETIQPRAAHIHRFGTNGRLISVRESFLPLVDVGKTLGFRQDNVDPEQGVALLVETEDRPPVALLVDQIHGQRQVVIKGLEANYGHVKGIAAATILGDGRIALILDVDALVTPAMHAGEAAATLPLAATG